MLERKENGILTTRNFCAQVKRTTSKAELNIEIEISESKIQKYEICTILTGILIPLDLFNTLHKDCMLVSFTK